METLKDILPNIIFNNIESYLPNTYEVRLRANMPVRVYTSKGVFDFNLGVTNEIVEKVLLKACENSIYAYNDQIKQCFISLNDGVRLGVCGSVVITNGEINTIKDISSINIRVPHEIKDCAKDISEITLKDGLTNLLVISPPGLGKTTFLRDYIRQIERKVSNPNTFIIDERCELVSLNNGISSFNLGSSYDVLSNCPKQFAFTYALRSMRPDIIITDEITLNEYEILKELSLCGVKVVASIHSDSIESLKNKKGFGELAFFDYFLVLSNKFGIGSFEGLYDKNFNNILNSNQNATRQHL